MSVSLCSTSFFHSALVMPDGLAHPALFFGGDGGGSSLADRGTLNFSGPLTVDLDARDGKWRELRAIEGKEKEGTEKTAGKRLVSPTELAHSSFHFRQHPHTHHIALGFAWVRQMNLRPNLAENGHLGVRLRPRKKTAGDALILT